MRKEVIGDATLYLGDCLDVVPTLPAASVDLVIVDPPYMVNSKSDGMGKLSPWADICNASLWFNSWMNSTRTRLSQSGALWTFLNWRSLATYQKASCECAWPIESLLVWDKKWIGPGGQRGLRPSYELAALLVQPDFAIPDRGLPDIKASQWSAQKPNGHPAEKPEDLMRWLIEISSKPDCIIGDWFMGSGTVGAAAISSGRAYVGIEMDPTWFDVSCRRIERAQRQADLFSRKHASESTPDMFSVPA
jgi:DNA modification methylase